MRVGYSFGQNSVRIEQVCLCENQSDRHSTKLGKVKKNLVVEVERVLETGQPVHAAKTRRIDQIIFDESFVGVFTLLCGRTVSVARSVHHRGPLKTQVELIEVLRAALVSFTGLRDTLQTSVPSSWFSREDFPELDFPMNKISLRLRMTDESLFLCSVRCLMIFSWLDDLFQGNHWLGIFFGQIAGKVKFGVQLVELASIDVQHGE